MDRNASDIFNMKEAEEGNEDWTRIYSVGGAPSGRRNRLRTSSSNVFPSGVLGNPETKVDETDKEDGDPKSNDKDESLLHLSNMKRNPLTGDGMLSSDMQDIKGRRKFSNI
ncbi:uncharacterized protein LOC108742747 [Agrilus planipennis]|uniref:Uncharacterized protein LOC108742747 n=1 Tax=Agrilus planipennis TaxID=224129 RepID=A0A1W4XM47_AGRPL|nr:uncharacterized protein LOC108742747 [Agrilus planipennis]